MAVYPVGVLSISPNDPSRARTLPVEVWYPAFDLYHEKDLQPASQDRYRAFEGGPVMSQPAVRDATAASGRHPLVIYSHGVTGHRRDCTHLCSHLASHGYVVAAIDHTGNTLGDLIAAIGSGDSPQHLSWSIPLIDSPEQRP